MEFKKLFNIEKPIIGMIHLAGDTRKEKMKRALEELAIYDQEGVDGAIIEDYYGDLKDVETVLEKSISLNLNVIRGVNFLMHPYLGFRLADNSGAKFIQFDSIQTKDLNLHEYNSLRKRFFDICVLGGVGFKYIPETGNPLEVDLKEAKPRCDAIVTTGEGTGIEAPIEKLTQYKELLKDFPLIVGAGVNLKNIYSQLKISNGAIVGSYFKPNKNTRLPVDRLRVKNLMQVVKEIRKL